MTRIIGQVNSSQLFTACPCCGQAGDEGLITKFIKEKDKEREEAVAEARREGAWIGFQASGEGFNGEYVGRKVTDKDIWEALDDALTPPDTH